MTKNTDSLSPRSHGKDIIARGRNASMLLLETPSGLVEACGKTLIWQPIKGPRQHFSLPERIISLCPCPGTQNSISSIIIFGISGLYLRIALPSLITLDSCRLDIVPSDSMIVHSGGQGFLLLIHESILCVRKLKSPIIDFNFHQCEEVIKLLHREGDEILAIHGMKHTRISIQNLIPLP